VYSLAVVFWSRYYHYRVIEDALFESTFAMRPPNSALGQVFLCWKPQDRPLYNLTFIDASIHGLNLRVIYQKLLSPNFIVVIVVVHLYTGSTCHVDDSLTNTVMMSSPSRAVLSFIQTAAFQ